MLMDKLMMKNISTRVTYTEIQMRTPPLLWAGVTDTFWKARAFQAFGIYRFLCTCKGTAHSAHQLIREQTHLKSDCMHGLDSLPACKDTFSFLLHSSSLNQQPADWCQEAAPSGALDPSHAFACPTPDITYDRWACFGGVELQEPNYVSSPLLI